MCLLKPRIRYFIRDNKVWGGASSILVPFLMIMLASSASLAQGLVHQTQVTVAKEACGYIELRGAEPRWASFAAWAQHEDSLLIVDVFRSRIMKYGLDGQYLEPIDTVRSRGPSLDKPSNIQRLSSGYLVQDEYDQELVKLDEEFNPKQTFPIEGIRNDDGAELNAVYSWRLVGDQLVVLGDVRRADSSWTAAFARLPLEDTNRFQIIEEIPLSDPVRQLTLIGYDFLGASSALENETILLASGSESGGNLVVKELDLDRGDGLKSIFTSMKVRGESAMPLSMMRTPISGVSYEAFQEADTATGLYYLGDTPMVTYRRLNKEEGSVDWWLSPLEKSSISSPGSSETRLRLPSTSSHVVVVPGEKHWAVIEKGPLLELLHQTVLGVWLVPTSRIRASLSRGISDICRD